MAQRSTGKTRAGGLWRWAGGKGRLLEQLFDHLDKRPWRRGCDALFSMKPCSCGGTPHLPPYRRWVVPFFGAGNDAAEAMRRGMAREYVFSDACEDVILAAQHWRAAEQTLLSALQLPIEAQKELFLRLRQQVDVCRGFHMPDGTLVELDYQAWRAFRFLYLQATSFNGIWRVNRRGEYNVPFGRKGSIAWQSLMEFELLRSRHPHVWLVGDFERTIDMADAGDLVYADPPYLDTHDYGVFTEQDHVRLAAALVRAARRGAKCWLSNSDTDDTRRIYAGDVIIHTLNSQRSISCKASTRGETRELLLEVA